MIFPCRGRWECIGDVSGRNGVTYASLQASLKRKLCILTWTFQSVSEVNRLVYESSRAFLRSLYGEYSRYRVLRYVKRANGVSLRNGMQVIQLETEGTPVGALGMLNNLRSGSPRN